jgi:Predicted pyridoxal phosphate-dependent enzyme apparently involved in regulation of cell wall biogenesis
MFQWFNVLSKAIHWKEKRGLAPDYFPKRLPNALAILALRQFGKLEIFNAHRRELAKLYYNELKNGDFVLPPRLNDRKAVYLRFAVRHAAAAEIIRKSWKKNLLIGDWYRTPVDPFDTLPETVGYKKGSCPTAERFAGKMINLPTHIKIGEKDARMIAKHIIQNRE